MPSGLGKQTEYGLFVHRGDGRYVWDEDRIGKVYYRESSAQAAADKMNATGEHGGNVVVRAKQWTQSYPRRNPARVVARRQRRRTARGRVAGRRRNSPADAKPVRAFTLSGVRVEFFQGYAEHIFYLRESDGRGYQHKVETDAAELYLCDHADFGHCLLIVDPTGKTPLWK